MGNQPGVPGGGGGADSVGDGRLASKGIKRMSNSITRRLGDSGGRIYNMKVVIRGDRETGKSALLRRLEGGPFIEQHIETPEIQTAHINWCYKMTDEVVLVEVWDVVDKGIPKKGIVRVASAGAPGTATTANGAPAKVGGARSPEQPKSGAPAKGAAKKAQPEVGSEYEIPVVDATFVDVYKGANAVIMLVDPTRHQTWQYAQKQLEKVPKNMDVLLLISFRDLYSRRVVSEEDVEQFMRTQPANVKCIEASLMNGYGLRHFYNFLNMPFLKMKLGYIEQEMKQAKMDLINAEKEIELTLEQDYDKYLDWLKSQPGKMEAPKKPSGATPMVMPRTSVTAPNPSASQAAAAAAGNAIEEAKRQSAAAAQALEQPSTQTKGTPNVASTLAPVAISPTAAATPTPAPNPTSPPTDAPRSSMFSRLFGGKPADKVEAKKGVVAKKPADIPLKGPNATIAAEQTTSPPHTGGGKAPEEDVPIDNFVPAGKLDAGFFGDDDDEPPARLPPGRKEADEDEKNKLAAAAARDTPVSPPMPSSNDDLDDEEPVVRRPVRSYDDDELEDMPSEPEPPKPSPKAAPVRDTADDEYVRRVRERERSNESSPSRPQPRVVDDELDDFEPMSSASPSLPGVRDPSPLRKSPPTSTRTSAPSSGPSSAAPSPRHAPSSVTSTTTSPNTASARRFEQESEPELEVPKPASVRRPADDDDELDMDGMNDIPAPVVQPPKPKEVNKATRPVDDDELDLPSAGEVNPSVGALGDFYSSPPSLTPKNVAAATSTISPRGAKQPVVEVPDDFFGSSATSSTKSPTASSSVSSSRSRSDRSDKDRSSDRPSSSSSRSDRDKDRPSSSSSRSSDRPGSSSSNRSSDRDKDRSSKSSSGSSSSSSRSGDRDKDRSSSSRPSDSSRSSSSRSSSSRSGTGSSSSRSDKDDKKSSSSSSTSRSSSSGHNRTSSSGSSSGRSSKTVGSSSRVPAAAAVGSDDGVSILDDDPFSTRGKPQLDDFYGDDAPSTKSPAGKKSSSSSSKKQPDDELDYQDF